MSRLGFSIFVFEFFETVITKVYITFKNVFIFFFISFDTLLTATKIWEIEGGIDI